MLIWDFVRLVKRRNPHVVCDVLLTLHPHSALWFIIIHVYLKWYKVILYTIAPKRLLRFMKSLCRYYNLVTYWLCLCWFSLIFIFINQVSDNKVSRIAYWIVLHLNESTYFTFGYFFFNFRYYLYSFILKHIKLLFLLIIFE